VGSVISPFTLSSPRFISDLWRALRSGAPGRSVGFGALFSARRLYIRFVLASELDRSRSFHTPSSPSLQFALHPLGLALCSLFFFTTFVYQPLFCIRLSPSPSIVAGLRFPHASFGSTGNCRYPRLKRPHHPIRVLSLPPPIIPSPPLVPSPCAAWPGIGGYGDSGDSSVVLWVVSLLSVSAHRLDRFGSVDCRAREV